MRNAAIRKIRSDRFSRIGRSNALGLFLDLHSRGIEASSSPRVSPVEKDSETSPNELPASGSPNREQTKRVLRKAPPNEFLISTDEKELSSWVSSPMRVNRDSASSSTCNFREIGVQEPRIRGKKCRRGRGRAGSSTGKPTS